MQPDLGTSVDIVLIATAVLLLPAFPGSGSPLAAQPQFQSCFFSS